MTKNTNTTENTNIKIKLLKNVKQKIYKMVGQNLINI